MLGDFRFIIDAAQRVRGPFVKTQVKRHGERRQLDERRRKLEYVDSSQAQYHPHDSHKGDHALVATGRIEDNFGAIAPLRILGI